MQISLISQCLMTVASAGFYSPSIKSIAKDEKQLTSFFLFEYSNDLNIKSATSTPLFCEHDLFSILLTALLESQASLHDFKLAKPKTYLPRMDLGLTESMLTSSPLPRMIVTPGICAKRF